MDQHMDHAVALRRDIRLAQAGGAGAAEAKTRILSRFRGLCRNIVFGLHTPYRDLEDGLQGAALGVLEALERFDLSRGSSFGAYARGFIIEETLKATFRSPRARRQASGSGTQLHEVPDKLVLVADEQYEAIDARVNSLVVRSFLRQVTATQAYVAGRIGADGATQAEVAAELGVSRQAVAKTWSKVVRKGRVALAAWTAA